MKHVILLGTAYPLRGGLAAYNERLAREFISQGYKVRIYTFSLQYPNFLFPGTSQYSTDPAPQDLDIRVEVNSINPLNWISTGRKIKKEAPDLLIIKFWLPFMAPCFGTIARIARKNSKTKVISILDNVVPHEHRPGDKVLTRYFVKAMDGFIAMSQQVMNDLLLFTKTEKRLLIPHPVYDNFGDAVPREEACRHLGLDPSLPYLLFFGFIRGYKGLDLLLEAMAQPILKDFKGKLIIAGEFYEDAAPYRELISKHNLKDKLILRTDFIPDAEVRYYFSVADLVVQPYKTATQSGISQMAYHFEKPMIVTRVGGLPELVPDGKAGFVVEANPPDIAFAIHRVYAENLLSTLTEGVTEEKKKYSWDRMLKGIVQLATN